MPSLVPGPKKALVSPVHVCVCICACMCVYMHVMNKRMAFVFTCTCACVCIACMYVYAYCRGWVVCVYAHALQVCIYTCMVPNSLSSAAGVQCCSLPPQPPLCRPAVNPTHFQPEQRVTFFTNHPLVFDVDFDTLIQEDPSLSAVELPIADEGFPLEGNAFPHPQ